MNDTITIPKSALRYLVRYLVLFVIAFIVVAYYQGIYTSTGFTVLPVKPTVELAMSAEEARLTKQAIEMVRKDIVDGKHTDTNTALSALSGELPESVRTSVLQVLGKPDIDFMRDALDILEGKIKEN